MGTFKVNGIDIKAIAEVISTSDARAKSAFFSSGKVLVTGLSDSSKTLANAPPTSGWPIYNIVGDKLKVNGVADSVARLGTRPNFRSLNYLTSISALDLTLEYNKSTDTLTLKSPSYTYYTATGRSVVVFELVGAGGGGGGGHVNFWGGATGGGGGGGGASVIGIIDMNQVPGGSLSIHTGYGGSGGGGKSAGSAGDWSYIACSGYNSCIAYGGEGGSSGNSSGSAAASGGSGGGWAYGNIPGIYHLFCCNGASGGSSSSGGGYSSSQSLTVPMDGFTFGASGWSGGGTGGGNNNTGGGGGGACGCLFYGECYPGGGGADRNNGGAGSYIGAGGGAGGANATGGGQSGGAGSVGLFAIFY